MTIIGNSDRAVYLPANSPSVAIQGDVSGYAAVGYAGYRQIFAAVYGPYVTSFDITVTGNVQSGGAGSFDGGIVLGAAGIIDNQGTVQGGAGILMLGYSGGGYVRNTGLITGRAGAGLYLSAFGGVNNAGTIQGASNGIYLNSGGDAANAGTISGETGITATYAQSDIGNAGQIRGTEYDGVAVTGDLSNESSGTIRGDLAGVNLASGGSVNNAGLINGYVTGIAGNDYGEFGVFLPVAVSNTGSINGGYAGIGISQNAENPAIYNGPSGRITGAHYGVAVYTGGYRYRGAPGSIGNAGYIEGGIGSASRAGGGFVPPDAGDAAIVLGAGQVINTGTISGGGTGVYFYGQAYLFTGNRIQAANTGVALAATGSVVNDGAIAGGYYGVLLQGQAQITNAGLITGGNYGVYGYGVDAITNTGAGVVSGASGIGLYGGGAVYNAGTIAGGAAYAVYSGAGLRLINTGLVKSAGTGNAVQVNGAAYIINDSAIQGTGTAIAIAIAGAASLYNYGVVKGASAITAAGGYVYNAGRILGTAGTGVALTAPGYIINAGTIAAGTAVALAGGASLYNYGQIDGGISAEAGSYIYNLATISAQPTSQLTLYGGLAGDGTIFLPGAAIIDGPVAAQNLAFTTAGETLDLGAPAGFAGTLQNFAGGDTIDLTGISLASITGALFSNGVLTLSEAAGALTLTFANPQNFPADTFSLFADGAGTGITLSPTTMQFVAPAAPASTPPLPTLASAYAAATPADLSHTASPPGLFTALTGPPVFTPPITLHA
jgi:hypothetical protein